MKLKEKRMQIFKQCKNEIISMKKYKWGKNNTKTIDMKCTECLKELNNLRTLLQNYYKTKRKKEYIKEIVEKEVEKIRARYKCAACLGAKCEHTLGCKAFSDLLKALI